MQESVTEVNNRHDRLCLDFLVGKKEITVKLFNYKYNAGFNHKSTCYFYHLVCIYNSIKSEHFYDQ